MGEPKREPVTKELFRIDPPKRGAPKPSQTLRQTPPPIPGSRVAHAGRERIDETPVILDPKVAVRISDAPPAVGIMAMGTEQLRAFLRGLKCVDKEDFSPGQFAARIMAAHAQNETDASGRPLRVCFMFIRTDDAQKWRLYDLNGNLSSAQKYEKCRHVCTLRDGEGESFLLYWETPELKQK